MKDAFIANQVRGLHSSGLYQVKQNRDIVLAKKALPASEFLNDKDALELLRSSGYARLTVGHVRHATAGKINDDNAHPFLVTRKDGSQLVGVHNGTLKDWRYKKGSDGVDVDSKWAFEMLAEEGFDAFEYFDGAFALVWYDSREPGSVFMCRNAERPLHYMITDDGKTMLGASEMGMLGWIAERNKFKPAKSMDGTDRMYYLKPGTIYKFSLSNIGDFESWDAPKYDAGTGVAPTTSNFTGTRSAGYYEDFDWGDGSEWRGHGMYRNEYGVRVPFNSPNRVPFRSTPSGGMAAMKVVKRALQEARDARMGFVDKKNLPALPPPTNDENERLESNLKDALDAFQKERSKKLDHPLTQLVYRNVFLDKPSSAGATPNERKLAQDMGIFGQVVAYEGILHDSETSEHQGQFEIMEESGDIREVEALVRFVTKGTSIVYEGKDPVMMVVVGYMDNNAYGFPMCILSPLTPFEKLEVESKLKDKNYAVH